MIIYHHPLAPHPTNGKSAAASVDRSVNRRLVGVSSVCGSCESDGNQVEYEATCAVRRACSTDSSQVLLERGPVHVRFSEVRESLNVVRKYVRLRVDDLPNETEVALEVRSRNSTNMSESRPLIARFARSGPRLDPRDRRVD